MSKNCPVLSLVLHLHHEACWCFEFWKQFLTVIQGQKKLFTIIHMHSLPVRRYGACTCVLDSLYSPWDDALPHWCCPSLHWAGRLWEICCINDIFPATRAERSKPVQNTALRACEIRILPHKLRKRRSLPFSTTSGVRPPCTKRRSTRRRTPWMSVLSSRLLKALLWESLPYP